MARHKHYRKYTKDERKKYYYQVVYCFVNDEDVRSTSIATKLGLGLQTTNSCLNEYIEGKFKELVLAREAKTIDKFVSICLEDDKNQKQ